MEIPIKSIRVQRYTSELHTIMTEPKSFGLA